MIFSQKLQLIRKNKGYTQEELAGKLDVIGLLNFV